MNIDQKLKFYKWLDKNNYTDELLVLVTLNHSIIKMNFMLDDSILNKESCHLISGSKEIYIKLDEFDECEIYDDENGTNCKLCGMNVSIEFTKA